MSSAGLRGWLWTALVLLVAVSTCLAQGGNNSTNGTIPSTTVPVKPNITTAIVPTKPNTSKPTTAAPPPPTTVPKTTPSSTKPNGTTAAPPPPPTAKGPTTASKTSSTTVITKAPEKPTTGTSTTTTPMTSTQAAGTQKIAGFDLGSFIGGIVLTLGILAIAYFGCRYYNSRTGVRYRTIDEHEAII